MKTLDEKTTLTKLRTIKFLDILLTYFENNKEKKEAYKGRVPQKEIIKIIIKKENLKRKNEIDALKKMVSGIKDELSKEEKLSEKNDDMISIISAVPERLPETRAPTNMIKLNKNHETLYKILDKYIFTFSGDEWVQKQSDLGTILINSQYTHDLVNMDFVNKVIDSFEVVKLTIDEKKLVLKIIQNLPTVLHSFLKMYFNEAYIYIKEDVKNEENKDDKEVMIKEMKFFLLWSLFNQFNKFLRNIVQINTKDPLEYEIKIKFKNSFPDNIEYDPLDYVGIDKNQVNIRLQTYPYK